MSHLVRTVQIIDWSVRKDTEVTTAVHDIRTPRHRQHSGNSGRALHLIDIENLCVNESRAAISPGIGDLYRRTVRPGPLDQFIVASDVTRSLDAHREFPGARILLGRGKDGAELALTADLDLDRIRRSFSTLVIASGDGYFTDLARQMKHHCLSLIIVSRPDRLAQSLDRLSDTVVVLPPDAHPGDGFTMAS